MWPNNHNPLHYSRIYLPDTKKDDPVFYSGPYSKGKKWTDRCGARMFQYLTTALKHYSKDTLSQRYTSGIIRKNLYNTLQKLNYNIELISGLRYIMTY